MYEVKIKVDSDDIYRRLTPSEQEKFEEIVITDVQRNRNDVIITAIAIEKKNYNEKKYAKLLEKELYLEEAYVYSDNTPLRSL